MPILEWLNKGEATHVTKKLPYRILKANAELSTRQVAENNNATGMLENTKAAQVGGNIAKHAREEYEERTGSKVVTDNNFLAASKKPKQIKKKD